MTDQVLSFPTEVQKAYVEWDEFLREWPVEKLERMTLSEYTKAGNKDPSCFCFWLEKQTGLIGGLGRSNGFKFGICSLEESKEKSNERGRVYDGEYGFYEKLGKNSTEAFKTVKTAILETVRAARNGDLEKVQNINVLKTVKWKIAFLYQDRENPVFPDIYEDERIREIVGKDRKCSHAEAIRLLMKSFDREKEDFLSFCKRSWNAVSWEYQKYDPKLSKKQWLELLKDPDIANKNNLTLLAHMKACGGRATCSDLKKRFGLPVGFYNLAAADLGRRVLEKTDITPCKDPKSQEIKYWVVPFKGRKVNPDIDEGVEGGFVWQFRKPLADVLNDLDLSKYENEMRGNLVDDNGPMEPDEIDKIVALLKLRKNLVLQGAPGTGKTYCVSEIVTRLCGRTKSGESHEEIRKAYKKLRDEDRVVFTTFHPTLDYENFIEGWKPVNHDESDEESETKDEFKVGDGIFKQIADRAANGVVSMKANQLFFPDAKVWKVSLGGTYDNPIRKDCLENSRIRITCWGNEESNAGIEKVIEEGGNGARPLKAFVHRMKKGDLFVSCYSNEEIDAVGIVEGDVEWLPKPEYGDFRLCRKIRWLWKGEPENVSSYMDGITFTLSAVYSIGRRFSPARVQEFLEKKGVIKEKPEYPPFVLIIDEINRGNISKIFGELITLLEADKREGAENEECCMLAYSNREFVVPQNLYIVGTMNTADRSIGSIDYALRRRFAFYSLRPRCIKDENFDRKMFLNISKLFVKDPENEDFSPNTEMLSEEFDPLDVWLGHSYFIAKEKERHLRWHYEIRPILMEYIRDGVLSRDAMSVIEQIDSEFER